MDDRLRTHEFYVASAEPPASRRPPITEVGIISWLRTNLFSSVWDSIVTLITFGIIGYVLVGFLAWALLEAQWEVVFLNMRVLGVGNQFPANQVWRPELAALILVFLSLVSVGVWGRLMKGVVIAVIAIAAMMILVPLITVPVEEPTVHTYIDANYQLRQINFIAEEGQQLIFTVQPLTTERDFSLATVRGYVENNNQQTNTSFDAFTTASTQVTFTGERDPSEYDLSVAVQILDAERNVVVQSDFTRGRTDPMVFVWTAPEAGWYTYTLVRDDEQSTAGAAWLKVDNLRVYRSTRTAEAERIERYGPQPSFECRNCGTEAGRTDMRFQGRRTLEQWFSLQLAPFLLETRNFFFMGLLVGIAGYAVGSASKRFSLQALQPTLVNAGRYLGPLCALLFTAYIFVQIAGAVNPSIYRDFYPPILIAFSAAVILYAITLLIRDDKQTNTRAVTLLWLISIPIVLAILSGFQGSPVLPAIPTPIFGGLLLTLLLSAVAIAASFPIGMMLALGRQSSLPVVSLLCTLFIEVIRGVPLITLLFMGRLILPFFGFGLGNVDLIIRIMVVMTLFTSAYMAEVIRGGLQIIPKGQLEAAHAVGLNDFWTTVLIVLPQALRAVIPAMMGQAVSLFKDSSLVYIVGLFEILGTMNLILGDSLTGYTLFPREGYLYVGMVYFVFCYLMAEVSRRIERTGAGAVRRETI